MPRVGDHVTTSAHTPPGYDLCTSWQGHLGWLGGPIGRCCGPDFQSIACRYSRRGNLGEEGRGVMKGMESPHVYHTPTLPVCPRSVFNFFSAEASQIWTNPWWVPTAKYCPYHQNIPWYKTDRQTDRHTLSDQDTDVTVSFSSLRSHNLDT